MSPRPAPRQAVWRRRRVWPWLVAALALVAVGGWQAARLLSSRGPSPAPVAIEAPTTAPAAPEQEGEGPGALRVPDQPAGGVALARGAGATATATVAVVDGEGHPVRDCLLELRVPGGRPHRVVAEVCDAVPLEPVPPGEYLLAVEAPGLRRGERPVHLGAGAVALEVRLEPGVVLAGRVLDATGVPVSGVSLVISPIGAVTRSDASGAFRLSVPNPGLYSIEAHNSELGGAERSVTAPDADVVLRLQLRSVLDLEVLAGDRPLEGAQAVLVDMQDPGPGGQYQADRTTGPDGWVRLIGFPPGTYLLSVAHPAAGASLGRQVVLREGTPLAVTVHLPVPRPDAGADETPRASSGPSPTSARPPAAPLDGGNVSRHPLVATLPAIVRGVVREPDGRPVADALVICEGCRGEAQGEEAERTTARTDAGGRFRLPSVSTHTWIGLVAMKDARRAWGEVGGAGGEVTLTLEDPVPVRGRVLGPDGAPAPGVAVGFSEPVFAPVVRVTDAGGAFSAVLPRGVYRVAVEPDPSGVHRTWMLRVPPVPDGPLEFRLGPAH